MKNMKGPAFKGKKIASGQILKTRFVNKELFLGNIKVA